MLLYLIDSIACLWVNINPEPNHFGQQEFEFIAAKFNIWHEHKRGAHKGLHEFYYDEKYILLINVFGSEKKYVSLKPNGVKILVLNDF